MSVPCPNTQPHRAHAEDNAHGVCGGVPKPEDLAHVAEMIREQLRVAEAICWHGYGPAPVKTVDACHECIVEAVSALSVFEPVLFPEESQ